MNDDEYNIAFSHGRMILVPAPPVLSPMTEDRIAAWIVRLDDALRAFDPTLGVLDFGRRLMPARFDEDGPMERYDRLTAILAADGGDVAALFLDETYREPEALARAMAQGVAAETASEDTERTADERV